MFKDNRFLNYNVDGFKKDLIAGITVGIVAIPLGMAFAIASGVKPEHGNDTTIIAGFLDEFLEVRGFKLLDRLVHLSRFYSPLSCNTDMRIFLLLDS